MPSIRKTKKRLKREMAENKQVLRYLERPRFPTIHDCHLYSAILNLNEMYKQELQQLKMKVANQEPYNDKGATRKQAGGFAWKNVD